MEKIVERGMLYDFYGELLTEHQKAVYEEAVLNDMSLSEIAEQYEISRQGVRDFIKRGESQLMEYENALGLAERFSDAREKISEIKKLASGLNNDSELRDRIINLSDEILNDF